MHAARKFIRGGQFASTDSLFVSQEKKTSQIGQNALESYARAGIVMTNWISYKHGD